MLRGLYGDSLYYIASYNYTTSFIKCFLNKKMVSYTKSKKLWGDYTFKDKNNRFFLLLNFVKHFKHIYV